MGSLTLLLTQPSTARPAAPGSRLSGAGAMPMFRLAGAVVSALALELSVIRQLVSATAAAVALLRGLNFMTRSSYDRQRLWPGLQVRDSSRPAAGPPDGRPPRGSRRSGLARDPPRSTGRTRTGSGC